ncbi:transferrin-binding protein-like solute binding protein [Conchiformibius steedae]|uniref:transferrin-binding protein-like solute binding protein n=1 Tax=Conchiformibius steedae TaxID=153493 RepID=UPI0026EC4608|nr:transferrin-binding protein-like solute binding protein [Conchiformibius steedae]
MLKQVVMGAVCALVLAACSSSGGSSSSVSHHSSNTGSGNAASKPKPAPVASTGKQYVVLGSGSHNLTFPEAAKIHKISVNGKTFDLAAANFGANFNDGWKTYGGGNRIGKAPPAGLSEASVWTGSQNATAGVVTVADSGQRFGFFNGKFTDVKTLPTGKVTYSADVVSTRSGGIRFSKYDIQADFATKKLTANVGDNIALNADIKGNRFESAANAATKVQGGFFGNKAAEIAGVFQNGDVVGAFGGKKK